MAIGIDYNTFWQLNPKKLEPFIEAFKTKQKQEQEQINIAAWLNGLYIQQAIAACFSKGVKYPEKPFSLDKDESKEIDVKEAAVRFEAIAIMFNQQFRKEGKRGNRQTRGKNRIANKSGE